MSVASRLRYPDPHWLLCCPLLMSFIPILETFKPCFSQKLLRKSVFSFYFCWSFRIFFSGSWEPLQCWMLVRLGGKDTPIYSVVGISNEILILLLFVVQGSLDAPSSILFFNFQDTQFLHLGHPYSSSFVWILSCRISSKHKRGQGFNTNGSEPRKTTLWLPL